MSLVNKFDVYLSKQASDNKFKWKATINKSSFPKINLTNEPKLFHLNEEKYKKSFEAMLDVFGVLPSYLFDYNVSLNGEEIIITGVTETTVRIAIVDLITQTISNASIKLVRPPLDFRVYVPQETSNPIETEVDLGGIFGDIGDY